MSMDRESRPTQYEMVAGTESPSISTARAAWQSIHFGSQIVAGTITYRVKNEDSKVFVAAVDLEGATIAPVSITPGMVLPVDQNINHAANYQLVFSAAQADGATFTVINKT